MRFKSIATAFIFMIVGSVIAKGEKISQIWLSHDSNTPDNIVISFFASACDSAYAEVNCGGKSGRVQAVSETSGVWKLKVPMPTNKSGPLKYRLSAGSAFSDEFEIRPYPSPASELRVAFIGDMGNLSPDYSALLSDDPHIIFTLGDNVANLWEGAPEGSDTKRNIFPFLESIKEFPNAFLASRAFMPILGNHDKEIAPRGKKYPPKTPYDISATAYRLFFSLPDEGWKWEFRLPDFRLRFIALDLQHTMDLGTTWQTCHDCDGNSEQFKWYAKKMSECPDYETFTLQNQHNGVMRSLYGGLWKPYFEKSAAVFSGYGYYQERAHENIPYYNTCLKGGVLYPDKFSKFNALTGGYILMRVRQNEPIKIEIKNLSGEILDKSQIVLRNKD